MILLKADHDRRIDIPGVAAPVRRPVDIDQAKTGFMILRTLRIYRFDKESVIEGHAEEDEVFIVVMAGSVELTLTDIATTLPFPVMLSAADSGDGVACAAYLPRHAAYKLIPSTDADVAYARATPFGTRPAKIFCSAGRRVAPGVTVLLEEPDYAERLRLRVVQFDCGEQDVVFAPVQGIGAEALVHIRTRAAGRVAAVSRGHGAPVWLESWDTLAAASGDSVTLNVAKGSMGLALIVSVP